MTECECPAAGLCQRHKVRKHARWHQLCQSNPAYFQAWENGHGPGQFGEVVRKRRIKRGREIRRKQNQHWLEYHRYAPEASDKWDPNKAQTWFEAWLKAIPSVGCRCANHFAEVLERLPPDFSNPHAFFRRAWKHHDVVSQERSGAPRITLEEAYAIHWPCNEHLSERGAG